MSEEDTEIQELPKKRGRPRKEKTEDDTPKRKRGRPRKENRLLTRKQWEDENKKAKGRPPGMKTAIRKFEERLLEANRIEGVIDKIAAAAMDDNHKHQAAAWKMIMDRAAPLSHYEKNKGGERPSIQINVSSIDSIKQEPPVIEGEYEES